MILGCFCPKIKRYRNSVSLYFLKFKKCSYLFKFDYMVILKI